MSMFTLQTRIKPLLLKGGGGRENLLVEVTVNSNEENSLDFFPITSKNSACTVRGSCPDSDLHTAALHSPSDNLEHLQEFFRSRRLVGIRSPEQQK
jgi:hypothetical protein